MKQRGFSLMEMMIVLLIVAIIAAASAPMVSKKMMRDAEGGSPWMYAGLGGSITYNPDGNQNKTAMIGSSTTPTGADKAKLYIETSSSEPQIAIGRSGDAKIIKFMTWGSKCLCISDTKLESNQVSTSTAMGYSAIAGPSSAAFGYNADARGGGATAIGDSTKAKGGDSTAVGYQSNANGSMATALGYSTDASGSSSLAVGNNTTASQTASTAIGSSAKASGNEATAVGTDSTASHSSSIAIGTKSTASADKSIAIGMQSTASGIYGTALGYQASAGMNTIALGYKASASGTYATALGYSSTASGDDSIALGLHATASGTYSTALGYSSTANGTDSSALGRGCTASGSYSTALGYGSKASGLYSTALGYIANATHMYSSAIGYYAKTTTSNQIVLGTSSDTVYIPGNLVVNKNVYLTGSCRNASDDDTELPLYIRDMRSNTSTPQAARVFSKDHYLRIRKENNTVSLSDRRLKNVGEVFSGGLDKIKQLKVYNFTFKDDESKTPHVGVMAQDLQKVFPDAVTKGKDGFLRIRWEDMFYSLINAVKELDLRITTENTELKKRVTELEKENKELEKRLSKLEKSFTTK